MRPSGILGGPPPRQQGAASGRILSPERRNTKAANYLDQQVAKAAKPACSCVYRALADDQLEAAADQQESDDDQESHQPKAKAGNNDRDGGAKCS